MTTYIFWFLLVSISLAIVMGLGVKYRQWKFGMAVGAVVLLAGSLWYFLWLEQVLVKRFGGVMHVTAAEGTRHLGSTWKDDNLWIESFNPADNTCELREYSRSGLLEGRVVIRDCNPLVR